MITFTPSASALALNPDLAQPEDKTAKQAAVSDSNSKFASLFRPSRSKQKAAPVSTVSSGSQEISPAARAAVLAETQLGMANKEIEKLKARVAELEEEKGTWILRTVLREAM